MGVTDSRLFPAIHTPTVTTVPINYYWLSSQTDHIWITGRTGAFLDLLSIRGRRSSVVRKPGRVLSLAEGPEMPVNGIGR
jgi:hypothetical protein